MEAPGSVQTVPAQRNIHQRINAVQVDVESVAKDRTNDHFKYKFIGHDDVTRALRGAKVKHGIVTEVTVNECIREGAGVRLNVLVTYVNMDDPRDRMTVSSFGESFMDGTRSNPDPRPNDLQIGKALSYAVKLAELKVFQLIGDSTPDSEQSHAQQPAQPADQRSSVSETELEVLLSLADGVKDKAGLDGLNVEINRVIKYMTKEQTERLKIEHSKASQRALAAPVGA